MKALAVTQECTNYVGSQRETDATLRYLWNTDFSRMVGTTASKLSGMTVPPMSNQQQTNCNCTIRKTHSLLLPTLKAYNSSKVANEGKHGHPRSEVISWPVGAWLVKAWLACWWCVDGRRNNYTSFSPALGIPRLSEEGLLSLHSRAIRTGVDDLSRVNCSLRAASEPQRSHSADEQWHGHCTTQWTCNGNRTITIPHNPLYVLHRWYWNASAK